MTELSDGERAALENLADKAAGAQVGWISIADALSLSRQGLAKRSREGWDITPAGAAMLKPATMPNGEPAP